MTLVANSVPTPQTSSKISTRFLKDAFDEHARDAVSFVSTLIRESVTLRASDVFIEPQKNNFRVRARVDGVMHELGEIPLISAEPVVSRIKVLSQLDPTEKRRVQEGQFTIEHEKKTINVRVEIAQTVHGELIVVRIHERESIIMELSQLGFSDQNYATYLDVLKYRSGLILVSGPTGCGKTTTLYSTINHINKDKQFNVMTVEDPVEYQMDGLNQMQTQNEIGFTFAEGLKTILRLSPDIVFVGEIRDRETAEIAVESGLTGQLVLSTIHADDAVGALFRMLDLDIEPYLLNSSLTGIVSQRLVRKICPNCITEYQPSEPERDIFQNVIGNIPEKLRRGKGCFTCQNLTFQGRTAIFEVLKMDANIREELRKNSNEDQLRKDLRDKGYNTLLADGLQKVEQGLTTTDEVFRSSLRVL